MLWVLDGRENAVARCLPVKERHADYASNKLDMRCDGFKQKNGELKAGAGGEYEAADGADAA